MLSYFFLGSIFFFAYFFFNLLAKIFNLYDYPNNRKIHNQPIPFTGGLIIITTLLIYIPFADLDNQLFLIILSSLPLVVIGTIDDIIPQRVSIRVLFQILCSLFLIGGGLHLKYLGNYYFIENIELGYFGIAFTIICVLVYVNSINFIDGLDGLSSGLLLISFISLLIIYNLFSIPLNNNLLYPLIFLIILFFFINLGITPFNKIFLGDSGSISISFIFAWILIFLSERDIEYLHPLAVAWIISFPFYDFSSIILRRILRNKNIFYPDNLHIHHLLLFYFKNKKVVLLIILSSCILINITGIFSLYYYNSLVSLSLFILYFIAYIAITMRLQKNIFLIKNI